MRTIEFSARDGHIYGYLHEIHPKLRHNIRPAVLICPGGGYHDVTPKEGDPIAFHFFTEGYQAFVMDRYSCLEKARNLNPLREIAEAVSYIRAHAEEFHINPDQIAIAGCSAGGHLAASLGALWNHPETDLPDNCQPNALILCYPVISFTSGNLVNCTEHVIGGDQKIAELLSVEKHVGPQMPPVFVWSTVEDERVPIKHTLMLVEALQAQNLSYECHIFAHGPHGQCTCTFETGALNPIDAEWIKLSKNWLNDLFKFIP